MICPPCAQAADIDTAYATQVDILDEERGHNPNICIDAGRTPEDIRLRGSKCTCQHGRNPEHERP